MEVTNEWLQNWATQQHEMIGDKDNVEYIVWFVPALFCTIHFINFRWYLPREGAPEVEWVWRMQDKNVEPYQSQNGLVI